MVSRPARVPDAADVPPPPAGGFGFMWRHALLWGAFAVVMFILPLGDISAYGLPIGVGLAGITVGFTSFRRQKEPFFMPCLRHGAGAGAIAVLPMVVFLFIATTPEMFMQGGVDETDAQYAPMMVALGICCLGMPLAMVMGALGGVAGALLAQISGEMSAASEA